MQSHLRLSAAFAATALLTLAPAAPALPQDSPADGFGTVDLPYPGAALTATLSGGDIVTFDGTLVSVYDAQGSHLRDLATLPAFAYGSFLISSPGETFVLLGESTFGNVYQVDLAVGGARQLTNLMFNFAAAFEDAGHAIVSAATCGFGCGNELYRVDTSTGATTLIATVGGASGPVAVEANGDVLYGRLSDTFSLGDHSVLRFAAADLTGSPIATEADALIVGYGFDGAAYLAVDPTDGEIYLAENDYGSGLNQVRWVRGDAGVSPVLLEGAVGLTIGNLEIVPGDGEARFRAYQPSQGGALLYNSTDFSATFERKQLEPARPSLALSGPGASGAGDLTLLVSGGAPSGFAGLLYGPTSLFDPAELALGLGGLEAPLFTGLDLATVVADPVLMGLDPMGIGTRVVPHDGSLIGQVTGQALVLDASFKLVQISSPASL